MTATSSAATPRFEERANGGRVQGGKLGLHARQEGCAACPIGKSCRLSDRLDKRVTKIILVGKECEAKTLDDGFAVVRSRAASTPSMDVPLMRPMARTDLFTRCVPCLPAFRRPR